MMEFSTYLDAIQQLPGKIYSEKLQSVNHLVENIIKHCETSNSPIEIHQFKEISEVLIPFIQLKLAEILKKPEAILDALKSDDPVLFAAALKIQWFFDGSVENYPNVYDFQHHVFPYISVGNRFKIIKTLAANLTLHYSEISEEFYLTIMEMYNKLEAQPLLLNCSESFVDYILTHHVIRFDVKQFKILLRNYYRVAVKYLKLCASAANSHAKNTYPPLETYQHFLPHILKHDMKNFIELIEIYKDSPPNLQLGQHCTELFLDYEFEILSEKPHLFMPILRLDKVTDYLTKSEFGMIFKNMFPNTIEEFDFKNLYNYLKYIPQDQKLSLMFSTFEEVYKVNLLDCDNKITPDVLMALPSSERIKQARKKFKTDKNWSTVGDKIENSWVCYLPVEESIPIIRKQIFKTTSDWRKIELLKQMIYTCKVNNDTNTLLDVLKYATTQYKNEGWSLLDFLKRLPVDFEMQYLPQEHWEMLNEFIDLYYHQGKIYITEREFQDVVIWGIQHDLINNLPINTKIDIVTEGNINGRITRWNLFKETPEFERLCIEKFMESIPRVYLEIHDNFTWSWPNIIHSFMEAIYDFNRRNSMSEVENVYVKSNPLFSDEVKKLVSGQTQNHKYFPKIKQIKQLLKINEPDLYYLWVEEYKPSGFVITEPLIQIENAYEDYLNHWEEYYEYCKNRIDDKSIQYIIHTSRWYQDLPIKFLDRCLKDIIDNKDCNAVKVLALLVEGPVFEEFIKSQISNLTDVDTKNSTNKHLTKSIVAEAVRCLYTLPSLEFISQLFEENDYKTIQKCLIKIGLRVPADKLLLLCQLLMNRSPAISKLSVNLIRDITTTQQFRKIIMDLWRTREHRNINFYLVKNILDAFIDKPCTETWEMIKECLTSLKVDDQRVLKHINLIDRIPNEYVADYIKLLLIVFKQIGDNVNSFGPEGVWFNTNHLLQNLPSHLSEFIPEELHEDILKTYLADLSLPKDVLFTAQKYLINCYILPAKDKLDSRLKFFLDLFVKILQSEQEIYDPDSFTPSYPVHDFLQGLIGNTIPIPHSAIKIKLINAILDTFLLILEPQAAPEFYCKFVLASLHDDETSPKDFGWKISQIIPGLIDSSVASVYVIARSLFDLYYYFYINLEAEGQLAIVESLLESNHDNNTLLAANFLLSQYFEMKNLSRFWKIVQLLKNHQNVAVVSCANLILSGFRYEVK